MIRKYVCVAAAAAVAGLAFAPALADTKLKSGDVLTTQTATAMDTSTLKAGDLLTLKVVAPYPQGASSLAGATITLNVTDVTHESPSGRARVGFLFDLITFTNGTSEPIAAFVLSSNVVQRGQVVSAVPTPVLPAPPPAAPMGGMSSTSANTIFWQRRIGANSNSSNSSSSNAGGGSAPQVSTGGYAYAKSGDAKLAAGSVVKIQLSRDLNVP